MPRFIVGREYRRSELHDRYGGNRQKGICPSPHHPVVFLFTGESGEQYGYFDGFQNNGTYWYTGEGTRGDMEWRASNRAIRDSQSLGKSLHLFEKHRHAHVRYIGEAVFLTYHETLALDVDGAERKVFVFELEILTAGVDEGSPDGVFSQVKPKKSASKEDLESLRAKAIRTPVKYGTPAERKSFVRTRSEAVRAYVQLRAKGTCECCGRSAPFERRDNSPYLESHHIRRLADKGPDHPRWVAAICPTCHREIHHGKSGDAKNLSLSARVAELEDQLTKLS